MPRKRKQYKEGTGANTSAHYSFSHSEIEAHFSKKFSFIKPCNKDDSPWTLPDAQKMFGDQDALLWNDPSLTALKNELNSVKDLLSDKDIVFWHQHTQDVNIAGKVVPFVRHRIQAELCTQAWCKFYEILCTFPLVLSSPSLSTLNSVHLCEAPGAFIAALNHYLALNYTHLKLSWLATTLNPYYEENKTGQTIPDDRFILPTLGRWDFGKDNTGNIFSISNRTSLIERAKKLGPIHLVTADGSIDCQNSPSEQETLVAPLHLVEVVTAFQLLAVGGNFVIKLFTCFEPTSVCLLYLLNCAFSQVHVFKPGTSKRGNSEIYVVGIDYIGECILNMHIAKIEAYLGQTFGTLPPMFTPQSMTNTFFRQMTECCTYFQKLQIEAIREHLRLFEIMDPELKRNFNKTRTTVAQMFLRKFGLAPIGEEALIIKNKVLPKHSVQSKPLRVGSLNQRKTITVLDWHQRIPHLEAELARVVPQLLNCAINVKSFEHLLMPMDHCVQVDVILGKEFQKCWNSHFCNYLVMHCWNDICQCIDETGHSNPMVPQFDDPELTDAILQHLTSNTPLASCQFVSENPLSHSLVVRMGKCWQTIPESGVCTKVYLDDLRYDFGSWDFCYSAGATLNYLSRFCKVLELCDEGNSLILAITPLLTRVDAGLLYILHCAFEKISLISVCSSGQPVEFAICHHYVNPISASLISKLKLEYDKEGAVMEIVNISSLFDEPFFSSLHRFNSCALMKRASFTLDYLKSLIPNNTEKREM